MMITPAATAMATGWPWTAATDSEGGTSKELIGTAFFAYSSGLLAKIARILDKEENALRYQAMSNEAREAFIKRFVHEDGSIEGGTQTSYVLALEFDLLPQELRSLAADELVRNIRGRDDHLSTGFVGTPYLTWVLSKTGHLDTAYALLKQTTWPSWLYSVTQGGTTIWERWDGWTHDKGFQDPKMNSFNHYAYGAVGAWMYAVIGGIDLDPDQPGYKHIVMHPQPGGGLTHVAAELDSMHGMIRSDWVQENDRFDWKVTVPANATATLFIPARDVSLVTENGQPLESVKGVTFQKMENGVAVLDIVSGTYRFSSRLK